MVNPDNTISSRNDIKRNSDKTSADKPEGEVLPEKFREVYAVYEHRKPKDEFEELEELLKKRKKEGKGLPDILESGGGSDKPVFNLKETKERESGFGALDQAELIQKADKKVEGKGKSDFYLSEQSDLAQVNPLSNQTNQLNDIQAAIIEKPQAPTRNNLQEIIDKIVNQVYKLENSKTGESSIVIVLNKDGPFKDVGIKISEFDSANKQVNITIDNLTQEAKNLLDRSESQLLLALERKGYQVQMLTTTTNQEILRLDQPGQPNGDKEQSKGGNSEGNPQKRDREEEENPEKE